MADMVKTEDSISQRVLQAFDRAHVSKSDRLRRAGLDAATLDELVSLYRQIGSSDATDKTPEDRRPVPVPLEELTRPRPGCV